jgi:hypothetical protein
MASSTSQPDAREESDHQRGRQLYEAYNDAGLNPWRTFDGRACPEWVNLSQDVQNKWAAVARFTRHEMEKKR